MGFKVLTFWREKKKKENIIGIYECISLITKF